MNDVYRCGMWACADSYVGEMYGLKSGSKIKTRSGTGWLRCVQLRDRAGFFSVQPYIFLYELGYRPLTYSVRAKNL